MKNKTNFNGGKMEVSVLIEEFDDGYREVLAVYRYYGDAKKKCDELRDLGRRAEIFITKLK